MAIEIRPARSGDEEGAVAVVRAVYEEYGFTWDPKEYHADLYDLVGHYFEPGHAFFLATLDGQAVGTVALELFPMVPGEPGTVVTYEDKRRIAGADCSLERLYVHPDARRLGAGARLFERVIAEAAQRKRSLLEMWSDKRFTDAHRLYQRYGAEVVGERICHDPDQSPEWGLMVRIKR